MSSKPSAGLPAACRRAADGGEPSGGREVDPRAHPAGDGGALLGWYGMARPEGMDRGELGRRSAF